MHWSLVMKTRSMRRLGDWVKSRFKPWALGDWKNPRIPTEAGRTKTTPTIFQVERLIQESGRSLWSPRRPQSMMGVKVGECFGRMGGVGSPN
jgi:hypothetical protein